MSRITRVVIICVSLFLVGLLSATSLQARPRAQFPRPPREGEPLHLQQFPTDTNREVANLPATSITANYGSWSKIVFQSYRDGNWEIYSANGDGTGQMRLTANTSSDTYPRLNRGGTRIVFDSNRTGAYQIYTMNPDGSGVSQLTTSSGNNFDPAWSPDGSQIAFESFRDGQAEIYVMNANGTGLIRLTNHPAFDGHPVWSPDGSKIAFTSDRGTPANTGNRVWVMNADGSSPQQLTTQYYCQGPNWSPDGTHIAFDADATNDGSQEIWLMNANGSGQTQVYDPPNESPQGYPGLTDAWVRGWSPDGSFVTYTRLTWIYYQGAWYWYTGYLEALDLTTSNGFRLVSTQGDDWYPDWQTTDIVPPHSRVLTLPVYSSSGNATVSWNGVDSGAAGLANYDIQYRMGADGAWTTWFTRTPGTSTVFTGPLGSTIYFRSRARDFANNLEAWPVTAGGDSNTTLYNWLIKGMVRDVRNYAIPAAAITASPSALFTIATQAQGDYVGYMKATGQHVFTVTKPGYSLLPPMSATSATDLTANYWIPPLDNQILEGDFETEIPVAWQINGPVTPTIVPAAALNGRFGAYLGQQTLNVAPQNISAGLPGSMWYPAVAYDPSGTLYLSWSEANSHLVYFVTCSVDGACSPVATSFSGVASHIAVGPDHRIHLIWASPVGNSYEIMYVTRLPGEEWSVPQKIASTTGWYAAWTVLKLDQAGVPHIVWNSDLNIYYSHRTDQGSWTSPEQVTSAGNANPGLDFQVSDNGEVQVVSNAGGTVVFSLRTFTGTWNSPYLIASDASSSLSLGLDSHGNTHILWQDDGYTGSGDGTAKYIQRAATGVWSTAEIVHSGSQMFAVQGARMVIQADDQVAVVWQYGASIQAFYRSTNGVWSIPRTLFISSGSELAVATRPATQELAWCISVPENGRSVIYVSRVDLLAEKAGQGTLSQQIAVPSDLHAPTLGFDYLHQTQDDPLNDVLSMWIDTGTTITRLATLLPTAGWTHSWVDLTPWQGQTITLSITISTTANGRFSWAYFDNVSLGSWVTPVIDSVSPAVIEDVNTQPLTITVVGTNFVATPTVHLKNDLALAVQSLDSETLVVTLPSGLSVGNYDIWVTNPGGQEAVLVNGVRIGRQIYLPLVLQDNW